MSAAGTFKPCDITSTKPIGTNSANPGVKEEIVKI